MPLSPRLDPQGRRPQLNAKAKGAALAGRDHGDREDDGHDADGRGRHPSQMVERPHHEDTHSIALSSRRRGGDSGGDSDRWNG